MPCRPGWSLDFYGGGPVEERGLAHPFVSSQDEVAPPFPRFLREGGPSADTTISMNAHQTSSIPRSGLLHFITFSCYHRMPLLDPLPAKQSFERELERVRPRYGCYITGYGSDARARPPSNQRTGTLEIVCGDPDAQTDHIPKATSKTSSSILAGPLLRFSCMDRSKAHREAALDSSQSGETRTGGHAGGLDMEQLCSLCNRNGRDCRDRIAVDGAQARTSGCRAPG